MTARNKKRPTRKATKPRAPIDMNAEHKHVRAYLAILKALQPLDDEKRIRVLRATQIIYELAP